MGQIKERLERYIQKFPLDHQSILKEFLKDSMFLKDQETVFVESQDRKKLDKKEKRGKSKYFLKKKKNHLLKAAIIAGFSVGILLGIEFILIKFLGITLNTQKEWLLPIMGKLSLTMGKFSKFIKSI